MSSSAHQRQPWSSPPRAWTLPRSRPGLFIRPLLLLFLLLLLHLPAPSTASPGGGRPDDDHLPSLGATSPLLQGPLVSLPDEQTLERQGIRLHHAPADRLAAQELSRTGALARQAIAASLGTDPGGRFAVYLASNQETFRELLGDTPDWMAGVAVGPGRWAAVRLDLGGEAPWRQVEGTFRHELAHLLLYAATAGSGRVPRWFSEGFAIYHEHEFSFTQARTLTQAILQGHLFPLAELAGSFPERPDQVRIAYAQSVAFTSFLIKKGEGGPFGTLLRRLSAGEEFAAAVQVAFGRSLAELEEEWRGQLQVDYAWVPLLLGGSFLWGLPTGVFLVAYAVQRVRRRRQLRRLEAEERLLEEAIRAAWLARHAAAVGLPRPALGDPRQLLD
ncbi:MAG: peptidase MA family metallohydrolase [Myxococcota bacterium]|nr:peptidase MA family metallohydrolase [Myxococcota bacterium]